MWDQKENQLSISVEDMYNNANRNYEWQDFKYIVPKHYHHPQLNQQNLAEKPEHKTNYIDDVLKIKKCVPAPNIYDVTIKYRPLSGKMDKNPRKTIADSIIDRNKNQPSPGPATYFTRPKTADSKMNRNAPEHKVHYLNEVEYLSSQNPGVGQYNINYFKTGHVISPKFKKEMTISRSVTNLAIKKQKKQKKLQGKVNSTLVIGTFDWIAAQKRTTNKNFFGKSKRFVQGSKYDKKPASNFYELNLKWTDQTNVMLKTSASSSNFKSVYYN